jgi:LacI family transcriptional regulator
MICLETMPETFSVRMRMRSRQAGLSVTIQDVAKAAQVSVSTVSRVINNKDDVSDETSQRVKEVVQQMGYSANLAARSMRSHRTGVIGLVMPDVEQSFPIQVMKGVNRAAATLDHDLIVYTSGDFRKGVTADKERHYVSLLNKSITDGVIVVTPAALKFPTDGPLVAVDPHNESSEFPSVISTNLEGAQEAVAYLLGLGHSRIAFIAGRVDLQSAVQRLLGYQAALRQAGVAADPELVQQGDFTAESGLVCARRLLRLENRPTAIFAANDEMAFGGFHAAAELGLSIPHDLSLVGFDNIPESTHTPAPLTTVDQFIQEMGVLATETLIGLIRGEQFENRVMRTPTRLVIRSSCQPLIAR